MPNRALTAARLLSGKALPSPAISDAYAAAGPPIGGGPSIDRISQREAKRHLSAYGGDQAIDTVHDCVNVYVDAALSAVWGFEKDGVVYKTEKDPNDPPETKYAPDDLVSLIENPNPFQDWGEFISLTVIDYLMVGNFYWLKFKPMDGSNRPAALYRLSPSDITVIPGKNELIAAYEYRIPGRAEPVKFPADMVIHGRRPNPHNAYLGLGVIASGARMLDVELASTETQAQFFEQGAKLSGVLQSDRRVPDPVFKKISAQFRNMYSGSSNAYKVAVLEQGLKFQSIQPTAAESEFVALSQLSFERICRLFRMPPELLGGVEKTGVLQEAKRQFTTDTMEPFLGRFEAIITRGLTMPGWGFDFEFDYKYVMPREDQLKLVAGFATLPGVRVNEVRSEAGLPPLPADETMPDGKPVGDLIINLPSTKTTEQGGHATQPLPGQVGRPPNMDNTQAFPSTQPQDVQRGSANAPRPNGFGAPPHQAAPTMGKSVTDVAEFVDEVTELTKAFQTIRMTTPAVPAGQEFATEAIQGNVKAALESPLHNLERALFDHVTDGKAMKKGERPRIVKAVDESNAWLGFEQSIASALSRTATDAMLGIFKTYGLAPDPSVVDINGIASELAYRDTGAKSIAGTLKDRTVAHIAEGVRRGYSTNQIINGNPSESYGGIRSMLKDWKDGQLEVIARTEAGIYRNEATLQVAEASGSGKVYVTDGNYDAACAEANGSVWDVAYARDHRLEHPNCTREFVALT